MTTTERLWQQIDQQQRTIDQLIACLTTLQLRGLTPADVVPEFKTTLAPLPPAVLEAVEARAKSGTKLWDDLVTFARGEMRKERDPESIATTILRGSSEEE